MTKTTMDRMKNGKDGSNEPANLTRRKFIKTMA